MANQTQNVVATAVSTSQINVSWDDVATLTGEVYDVERNGVIVGNDYAGAHTVGSPYADTGLSPGTTYTYRVRAVGTAGFSPPDVAGLVAWYTFDNIATLWQDTARTSAITADGQTIKGVTDMSGVGNHLSEATNGPTYKTSIINSNSVAQFDGTNDSLGVTTVATYSQPFTFFMSGNYIVGTSQKPATDGAGGGHRFSPVYLHEAGATDFWASYYGTAVIDSTVATNTSVHVWQATGNGASSRMRVDGGANVLAASTPGSDSITNFKLANDGAAFSNINFLEFVLYTGALSNADIQSVGAYMAVRAGTSWTAVS